DPIPTIVRRIGTIKLASMLLNHEVHADWRLIIALHPLRPARLAQANLILTRQLRLLIKTHLVALLIDEDERRFLLWHGSRAVTVDELRRRGIMFLYPSDVLSV